MGKVGLFLGINVVLFNNKGVNRLMKHSIAIVVSLMTGIMSMPATATCADDGYTNRLNSGQTQTALRGKRILATGGGEQWNEDHCSNGDLYKVGVSDDPVDPYAFRGKWGVSGSAQAAVVTYNYTVGGSSTYSWSLWENELRGLCWEGSGGNVIATAPAPRSAGPCSSSSTSPASRGASKK